MQRCASLCREILQYEYARSVLVEQLSRLGEHERPAVDDGKIPPAFLGLTVEPGCADKQDVEGPACTVDDITEFVEDCRPMA